MAEGKWTRTWGWRLGIGLAAYAMTASGAWAHARLVSALPAHGAVVAAPPTHVRLVFNSLVERRFARFELISGAAAPRPLERAPGEPGRVKVLEVPLPPIGSGTHRLRWSVVSADGHRVEGETAFTIR